MLYTAGLLALLFGSCWTLKRCDPCTPDINYAVCINDYTIKLKVVNHTMTNWLAIESVLEYENVDPEQVGDFLENTEDGRTYDRLLSRHRYEIEVIEVFRMYVEGGQDEVRELETFADPSAPGIPLEVGKTYIVSSLFGMDPSVSTKLDLNGCGGFAIEVGTADVREAHVIKVFADKVDCYKKVVSVQMSRNLEFQQKR